MLRASEVEVVVLIDTHCHIDRFRNPSSLAAKCESGRITTVAVTNIPSHYELAKAHLKGMQYVKPALGLHPLAVGDSHGELPLFLRLLPEAQFIGEIGLDFSTEGLPTRATQVKVFSAIIEALAGSSTFVTMHSRAAADDVLDTLKRFGVRNAVFHWFSGTLRTLDNAIEWGCWFSINTSMIRSQKGAEIISRLPEDRVLTESDGPYVKIGRRPAEPSDVRLVVEALSESWGVSVDAAERQVHDNFIRACGRSHE